MNELTPYRAPVEYGGFWRRLAAYFIDAAIITLPLAALWLVGSVAAMASLAAQSVGSLLVVFGLVFLGVIVLPLVYYAALKTTLGKRAMGLRVVDARTGGDITTGQAIGRYFSYVLSAWVLYLGFLWIIWDERKQGFHDKLAKTVVIRV